MPLLLLKTWPKEALPFKFFCFSLKTRCFKEQINFLWGRWEGLLWREERCELKWGATSAPCDLVRPLSYNKKRIKIQLWVSRGDTRHPTLSGLVSLSVKCISD